MTRYAPEDYHGQHDPDEEDRFELETMREQWEAEQDERDLPPHKRSDYAEKMEELADMLRDEAKERGFK